MPDSWRIDPTSSVKAEPIVRPGLETVEVATPGGERERGTSHLRRNLLFHNHRPVVRPGGAHDRYLSSWLRGAAFLIQPVIHHRAIG